VSPSGRQENTVLINSRKKELRVVGENTNNGVRSFILLPPSK
jgi:hypothetical protein